MLDSIIGAEDGVRIESVIGALREHPDRLPVVDGRTDGIP
jgi:hypothetical protein